MTRAIVAIAVLLGGCVTTSPIQPIGGGLYSITSDSGAPGATVASTRTDVLSKANDFCAQKHQTMALEHADDKLGLNHATTTAILRCQ